jgi:hypothetical protein
MSTCWFISNGQNNHETGIAINNCEQVQVVGGLIGSAASFGASQYTAADVSSGAVDVLFSGVNLTGNQNSAQPIADAGTRT